jgi:hypothetical protein
MSTFPLSYCPWGDTATARLRELFVDRVGDRICAAMEVPSAAMDEFKRTHVDGYCDFPDLDDRARFWDGCLAERVNVHDDSVPSAYLSEMDQGLYGGMIGGDVRFLCDPVSGWISSMVPPIISQWEELEQLKLDTQHPWFQRYIAYLDFLEKAARGRFGLSHFILISGLNFVFELVGATETYYAMVDRPEIVRRAIQLGFEVNVKVQETFFERVPLVNGGTCSNMVQWIPGRIVSESVDPFHMTKPRCFEEWGRENLERIFSCFDGGVLHLHANGRHLIESVATVRGLKAVCLSDDRGFQAAFDFLPEARRRIGNMPLIVWTEYADFLATLDRGGLTGGVLYRVRNVPDIDTANRLMDRIRSL